MKIALLGYGKMGRAIAAIAEERGHSVGVIIDNEADWMDRLGELKECDAAVEFSTPGTVVGNIMRCFDLNIPVVVGTTGWYDQLERVVHDCQQRGQALFVASNFSIGMNMMFELNRRLARLMNRHDGYTVGITETHHKHKLDAPSGTAITLAKEIIEELDWKSDWRLVDSESIEVDVGKNTVPIVSFREGEVPGVHEVRYDSAVDTITLYHSAKNRTGLAVGAVLACEFMVGRKGYHTMKDLLT